MVAVTAKSILKELEPLGSEGYARILRRHGARDPVYGVKVSELKKFQKRFKKDYALALALYDTGVYDAIYLAGLIADDLQMTKKDLQRWADASYCMALSNTAVAWVAAQSPHGHELALKWIESKKEQVATAGWTTLSGLVALTEDEALDLAGLKTLLQRVANSIHDQPNDVRSAMNHFVISVGTYVKALTPDALRAAGTIGPVTIDHGETECHTPDAAESIKKVQARGALGKKRKTVKC